MTFSWRELLRRFERLVAEYGVAVLVVHYAIFFATLLGFWVAITNGFEPEGWIAGTGTLGGAYLATKLTQPIRIASLLVLVPLAVSVWRRMRGRASNEGPSPADQPTTEPPSPG